MRLAVLGATGHLGRLTVDHLVARGVAPVDVLAIGRNTSVLDELGRAGFGTAVASMNDPAAVESALRGVSDLLLISGNEFGRRVAQHTDTIDAAQRAGVSRIIYTSVLNADAPGLPIASEHIATETYLRASGLNHTILRNAWYTENHRQDFDSGRATGAIISNLGAAPFATATRADLAEAAAITLAETTAHSSATYELSGDTAWTYYDLAREASAALGTTVTYQAVDDAAYAAQLAAHGLDEVTVGFQLAVNANLVDGLLGITTTDLARLLGRPTTPLRAAVASWAAQPTVYGGTG